VLHWAHAIRVLVAAAVAVVVISSSALAAAASQLAAPEPQSQLGQPVPAAADPGAPGQEVAAAQDGVDGSPQSRPATTQARVARERRQDAAAAAAEVKAQGEVRHLAAAQRQQAAQQQAAQQSTPDGGQAAVPQVIQQAFAPLGPAAVQWALTIARRESGYDPSAQNPSGAAGLFQFMPSTFAKSPPGQAGKSIWDPAASAEAAAWMYEQGRQNEWSTNY
jgi:soluble lytic murein transglycosylase-like protein